MLRRFPAQLGFLAVIGVVLFITVAGFALGFNFIDSNRAPIFPKNIFCIPTTNPQTLAAFVPPTGQPLPPPSHIKTPKAVRGIYMTSWVAGIPSWRERLFALIHTSELNSVVIDIKDYSGKISFKTGHPGITALGVEEERIKDIRSLIARCHALGIYTIGRITVFQDPEYCKRFPKYAIHTKSGQIWRDRNGLAYVDPSSRPFWEYIVSLAKVAEAMGFDEINFDYIRFPTDGNLQDMAFPISGGNNADDLPLVHFSGEVSVTRSVATYPKARVLQQFFAYVHSQMKPVGIPISADLFGMVLTNQDDLSIGQILEVASPYFDYICPMIYPSHYPPGFKGFSNPAEHPYEIVSFVLKVGAARLDKTPKTRHQLRPWLQDFNLGAHYGYDKIMAQKKGVADAGLSSWLMWDARNRYTPSAYSHSVAPK